MKLHTTLFAATFALLAGAPVLAADDHKGHDHASPTGAHAGHDDKAKYGGVVSVVKDVNYELVIKGDTMALYVSDHGKPVDLKGATAKVTLLSTAGKSEVDLAQADGRLEGKGRFIDLPHGTKAMANVTLPGQPAQAVRFTLK
jgi:hypothetical protein